MLFTGVSEHTIDSKQRLAIPAKYRNQWSPERDGGAWFCVPWPGGILRLYTEMEFKRLSDAMNASLHPAEDAAELETNFFGFAERLEMDSAGRISIPKEHLELAELSTEVVVIGARNRLEVRDRQTWNAGKAERFQNLKELARRATSPGPIQAQHPAGGGGQQH